jgi:hypothetical protein
MYILSEVIDREINTPEVFDSVEKAREEMCSRIAEAFNAEKDDVLGLLQEAILNDDEVSSDDEKFTVAKDSAYGTRSGENFDWRIHEV